MSECPPAKRARIQLTATEKKALCLQKGENPSLKQHELSAWCEKRFGKPIKKNTVSDILKHAKKWLAVRDDCNVIKDMKCRYPQLETALWTWIITARSSQPTLCISDAMLLNKARKFGEELGITNFEYSTGWLCRFKKRHNLKSYRVHGEAATVDLAAAETGRADLQQKLSVYPPEMRYNFDETSLFIGLQPTQTLATAAVKGGKGSKDRVTVGLCSNASGTDKRRPLVIGKSKNPRCFKNFDPSLYTDYASNRKAWMTSVEFHAWLKKFDRWAKTKRHKVALVIDNATSHKTVDLEYVTLFFLPPNMTTVLQPLDAGIIRSFKAHYRCNLALHYVDCVDNGQPLKVNMRDTVCMVKRAWDAVSPQTISNCWKHVGLFSDSGEPTFTERDEQEDDAVITALENAISRLPESDISASQYVNIDSDQPTEETMTEEQIIELVTDESHEVEEEDDELIPPISVSQARLNCLDILRVLEEKAPLAMREGLITNIMSVYKGLEKILSSEKKQTTLNDYFK